MAFENTTTEHDMHPAAKQLLVQSLRRDNAEFEPDLVVDGMSDSILSRIVGMCGFGRS